jgi:Spy/CpxP family protein refolding chaperone
MRKIYTWSTGLLGLLLAATVGVASAQPCPGYGMGPGMMGGGPGYGMGPGMMGGGPGWGMGPGMMGPGYGAGPWGLARLNLTDDQQKAINKIVDDHRKRQHDLLGKMAEHQARLRDQYQREKWDADAINKIYDQMADVRRQMIRSRVEMRNQIFERLTPEQRQQFRRTWVE